MRSAEIGPYRILRLIRRGGGGTVYAAHDQRLNRRVALKLIAMPVDREQRESVVGEARALARLNHRSIVQIFDVVETRSHIVLVMEYVPGTDLESLCKQVEFDLAAVLQLGTDLCAALAAAHQMRIVHRDLKPGNILLDPGGHLKLTDFGIARLLENTDSNETTLPSVVPGSYQAMSPEHAAGMKIDERADNYALGLILYRLLVGRHPFADAANELVLLQQLQHTPHRPLLEHKPLLPVALGKLVDQLLSTDPRERIASALQVRQSLLAISRKLPINRGNPLAALIRGRCREEAELATPVKLPVGVAQGARSRLLSRREWGPWGVKLPGIKRNAVLTLAVLLPVLVLVYLGDTWWSQRLVRVMLATPVVLGSSGSNELPGEAELGETLQQLVRANPALMLVDTEYSAKIYTRVRCNDYLCELQLTLQSADQSISDYSTLLPDVPARVWRAQLSAGLDSLFRK